MAIVGPHFLGIGMQKAGTSWLYDQLKPHPELWLPNRKEIHFFDSFSNDTWNIKRQARATKNITEIAKILDNASSDEKPALLDNLAENVHFAKPVNDFDWYRDFWRKVGAQDKICGEITPAYSILDVELIQRIHDELGVKKVLLILRDPVERAWSQYKMMTERVTNDPETVYKKDKLLQRSRAKTIIENWESVYGTNALFIGFYEDIRDRPLWFLSNLCEYLGVSFDESFFPAASIPIRVSRAQRCPKNILDFYVSEFSEDIKYVAHRFGGHADAWAELYRLNQE